MSDALLACDITKRFGERTVLAGVSLRVEAAQILCVMGPSGSGKTTLLRILAGLDDADTGTVHLGGRDVTRVATHRRGVGLVFQDLALFPHLDVAGNIAFGLRMHGIARAQRVERVRELLDLVDLSGAEHRNVSTLSGGEQQRVALARALAPRPTALLLDEPFGALDETLARRLGAALRSIVQATGTAAVHVTHDAQEAAAVGDSLLRLG